MAKTNYWSNLQYSDYLINLKPTIDKVRTLIMPPTAKAFFGFIFDKPWTEPEIEAMDQNTSGTIRYYFVNKNKETEILLGVYVSTIASTLMYFLRGLELEIKQEDLLRGFFYRVLSSIPEIKDTKYPHSLYTKEEVADVRKTFIRNFNERKVTGYR